MWVFPKNMGFFPPKWMVYNGKPYEQMDDLGVKTHIFGSTPISKLWGLDFTWELMSTLTT